MHIIHIASEMAPAAKVGGLGDVILGLSRELQAKGHTVEVILPKYSSIDYRAVDGLSIVCRDLWSYLAGGWCHNTVWKGRVAGIKVFFIEPHNPTHYFCREHPYGYPDDIERFTYFSRAALEFLLKTRSRPDILHLHEWQTALIAPLYWDIYRALGLNNPAIVMTLHNLEHQGHCTPADLDRVGLKGLHYLTQERLAHDGNPLTINLLKGGIVYSNLVTTVSPTYAREIQTVAMGHGLDHTLRTHASKLKGILNGLDYAHWSPKTDTHLIANYEASEEGLQKKAENKRELQRRLLLAPTDSPLIGCVARLVPQKGVSLIKHAMLRALSLGAQFVLLGSSPIPAIRDDFHKLKVQLCDNVNVHLELQHHEELIHLIFAGADLFIVPSIFEPCGLTQLISLAYGTIPIVRRTGGLADTIVDIDNRERSLNERNGFVFDLPTPEGVNTALDRALVMYSQNPTLWKELQLRAMRFDFSWKRPALEYIKIYESARKLIELTP